MTNLTETIASLAYTEAVINQKGGVMAKQGGKTFKNRAKAKEAGKKGGRARSMNKIEDMITPS